MATRRSVLPTVLVLAFAGAAASGAPEGASEAEERAMESAAFHLDDLLEKAARTSGPYFEFLRTESLSAGIFRLPAGGVDRQLPHDEDEIYYVLSGRARLTAGQREVAVSPGSVVYVAAGVDHRFHDISEDLEVLVFFSAGEP